VFVVFPACSRGNTTREAVSYLPSAAPTYRNHIQIAQNNSARIITGCTRGTPTGLLNSEAGLLPIEEKTVLLSVCAYDRALRLPTDNPGHTAALSETSQRLKAQCSWRETARNALQQFDLLDAQREDLLPHAPCPPWESAQGIITINDDLLTSTRRTDPSSRRYKAAVDTLASLDPADIAIWSDGSAVEATKNGGAGVYIHEREGGPTDVVLPAGKLCSSYRAEAVAFREGAKWLSEQDDTNGKTVTFLSYSKSLISRLKGGPP
jgi:hypothetical protein